MLTITTPPEEDRHPRGHMCGLCAARQLDVLVVRGPRSVVQVCRSCAAMVAAAFGRAP